MKSQTPQRRKLTHNVQKTPMIVLELPILFMLGELPVPLTTELHEELKTSNDSSHFLVSVDMKSLFFGDAGQLHVL